MNEPKQLHHKKQTDAQQNPAKASVTAHVMQEQSQRDHSDVLGSYTGTPADGGQPVQDQDDL